MVPLFTYLFTLYFIINSNHLIIFYSTIYSIIVACILRIILGKIIRISNSKTKIPMINYTNISDLSNIDNIPSINNTNKIESFQHYLMKNNSIEDNNAKNNDVTKQSMKSLDENNGYKSTSYTVESISHNDFEHKDLEINSDDRIKLNNATEEPINNTQKLETNSQDVILRSSEQEELNDLFSEVAISSEDNKYDKVLQFIALKPLKDNNLVAQNNIIKLNQNKSLIVNQNDFSNELIIDHDSIDKQDMNIESLNQENENNNHDNNKNTKELVIPIDLFIKELIYPCKLCNHEFNVEFYQKSNNITGSNEKIITIKTSHNSTTETHYVSFKVDLVSQTIASPIDIEKVVIPISTHTLNKDFPDSTFKYTCKACNKEYEYNISKSGEKLVAKNNLEESVLSQLDNCYNLLLQHYTNSNDIHQVYITTDNNFVIISNSVSIIPMINDYDNKNVENKCQFLENTAYYCNVCNKQQSLRNNYIIKKLEKSPNINIVLLKALHRVNESIHEVSMNYDLKSNKILAEPVVDVF